MSYETKPSHIAKRDYPNSKKNRPAEIAEAFLDEQSAMEFANAMGWPFLTGEEQLTSESAHA